MRHAPVSVVLALALAATSPAAAHHVWIAPDQSGALSLHFGEFAANLKEVSGKLLDRIEPNARRLSPSGLSALTVTRGGDGIALGVANLAPGESVVAEDARYPIRERREGEQVTRALYQPAARFVSDLTPRTPDLTLDLVPTGEPGSFRATLRGAPLAEAEVSVQIPSGWSRTVETDADGRITIPLPWQGLYVLEVAHHDETPGTRDGAAYDHANFSTSLSFVQPEGLPALPPGPPAPPND